MADTLDLCFGVHNHQPIGNFESVVVEATERAYRPFLEVIQRRPELKVSIHTTGNLLEWLRDHAAPTFDLLGQLVTRGQVELLTGGFYEPILAILPDADKLGQIARLSDFLKTHFGVRPRGMWLAERVWEPHLPRALRDAGVEYVLVDDTHFALAGLDPDAIGGYYLTEEQGSVVAVFPISQRLRYLIPFADVDESLVYLERRRGTVGALTVVDDGEKFGAWPGTHDHVYRNRWLERFFDRVLATPWLRTTTFSDVLDRSAAGGRVYLPTASYREMGEWALSAGAGSDLERAKHAIRAVHDGEHLVGLLRGGFWRSFLVKYAEVADTYWKMVRQSEALRRELARNPDDPRLDAARTELWRGQANDAYWHGVFGGCYLPHLRRAVKHSLLECERRVSDVTGATRSWWRGDANGDGCDEVIVRTPELAVTVNPERGGTITELAWVPRALDLADVLTRRPELYHERLRDGGGGAPTIDAGGGTPGVREDGLAARLEYDAFRRASLMDAWVEHPGALDAVTPWTSATLVLAETRLDAAVDEAGDGIRVRLEGQAGALRISKTITARGATLHAHYRVRSADGATLRGRWVVQWNLALTAGSAPGRYLDLPDRPSLASRGHLANVPGIALVDEWADVRAELAPSAGADAAWGPVETVSVSEQGFERIYQGTALTLAWPVEDRADFELEVTFAVGPR